MSLHYHTLYYGKVQKIRIATKFSVAIKNIGTFEKLKDFLITIFLITKSFSLFLVIASSFLHVIANRRVGKCAGVKQSPYCTFLLVLSVLRRLLRLIAIRLAMTKGGIRSQ